MNWTRQAKALARPSCAKAPSWNPITGKVPLWNKTLSRGRWTMLWSSMICFVLEESNALNNMVIPSQSSWKNLNPLGSLDLAFSNGAEQTLNCFGWCGMRCKYIDPPIGYYQVTVYSPYGKNAHVASHSFLKKRKWSKLKRRFLAPAWKKSCCVAGMVWI